MRSSVGERTGDQAGRGDLPGHNAVTHLLLVPVFLSSHGGTQPRTTKEHSAPSMPGLPPRFPASTQCGEASVSCFRRAAQVVLYTVSSRPGPRTHNTDRPDGRRSPASARSPSRLAPSKLSPGLCASVRSSIPERTINGGLKAGHRSASVSLRGPVVRVLPATASRGHHWEPANHCGAKGSHPSRPWVHWAWPNV